jgi:hypothetical protein
MAEKHRIELDLLAETYGVRRQTHCEQLKKWLAQEGELNEYEQRLFNTVYAKAQQKAYYWNEEELKMHLVSPLMLLANIEEPHKIEVFYERPISAVIAQYQLSVICDCLVATPMQFNKPKKPYFFLQEYKRGRGDDKDPEAQMLAAMLIAQFQNKDNQPLYGSYVIGSNWWFTTLIGSNYCGSRAYDIDNYEDLLQIIFILRQLRNFILER